MMVIVLFASVSSVCASEHAMFSRFDTGLGPSWFCTAEIELHVVCATLIYFILCWHARRSGVFVLLPMLQKLNFISFSFAT